MPIAQCQGLLFGLDALPETLAGAACLEHSLGAHQVQEFSWSGGALGEGGLPELIFITRKLAVLGAQNLLPRPGPAPAQPLHQFLVHPHVAAQVPLQGLNPALVLLPTLSPSPSSHRG